MHAFGSFSSIFSSSAVILSSTWLVLANGMSASMIQIWSRKILVPCVCFMSSLIMPPKGQVHAAYTLREDNIKCVKFCYPATAHWYITYVVQIILFLWFGHLHYISSDSSHWLCHVYMSSWSLSHTYSNCINLKTEEMWTSEKNVRLEWKYSG